MKILFISISFPEEKKGDNIYTQLAVELAKKHKVTIMTLDQNIEKTIIREERNLRIIRVKTGKIFNTNLIRKGISFITMQGKFKKIIDKYLDNNKFDLIIFMAPPVTLGNVIKYAMKKFKSPSYLMQKDIFPQNSIDLKILNKINPIYWYFRLKEMQVYKTATKIGCMSEGNLKYILDNNKYLNKEKLELFPNTIKLASVTEIKNEYIRKKLNISVNNTIAIYGGNFGKPQGIDFICEVLNEYKNNSQITFLFLGDGTEKQKLYSYIKENNIDNAIALDFVLREEYKQILSIADIGLIFLDYRFTIPNIPSRTLSYFESSIPIMAATDKNTDYKDILKKAQAGRWCESNNLEEYKKNLDYLISHPNERKQMGRNGRRYLEENWTVEKSVEILENTYKKLKKEGR